ncbi:DUF4336 domain-containing protein [Roseospira visakhapatnamensis]|uniref:DUF4336 domain-containing protein n=1 Tax=Roseospira visakhapatnamensis TaxID=390880 RepID=A0A7W6RCE6_9PROT|nr:DUF4336 domain-containing protein [Roseospira visakhapatnamensis]MBB4265782.1 hypothetical protein [Roseospira visakhapatnamensis]
MPLDPVDKDLWIVEGPVVSFYGFPYPTRSVIARLPDGGLWVWSPVALTDDLREAIHALGPVSSLVSPNALHHLWLADWIAAWPQASVYGLASLARKRRDLTFTALLEDTPPTAWGGMIDQAWLRASVFLDEIVFFHRPSRTAIVGDYCQAFEETFLAAQWSAWQRPIARVWGITEAHGRAPLELRLTTLKAGRARAAVQRILAWAPERVVMAHGRWQRSNGQAWLRQSFDWLL